MGRAGDSKTFLALAAALMAGLVISTMLAINAKLGFVRQPAWLEFQKESSTIPANKESDA